MNKGLWEVLPGDKISHGRKRFSLTSKLFVILSGDSSVYQKAPVCRSKLWERKLGQHSYPDTNAKLKY